MNQSTNPVFTDQTRLSLTDGQSSILIAYAELYGKAERSLFSAMQSGRNVNELKRLFHSFWHFR